MPSKATPTKMSLWQAVRDVLIASLNKGQFLVALSFLTVFIILLKMPAEDVSKLAFEIVRELENTRLLGYLIGILASGGWYSHSRWQRRKIAAELTRLAAERDQWQKKALKGKVTSSNTRRLPKGR